MINNSKPSKKMHIVKKPFWVILGMCFGIFFEKTDLSLLAI